MAGQPSETDKAKGYPVEGNPNKKNYTHSAVRLPISEPEAIIEAESLGIPAEFARREFNRMISVGWLDGCKRPVLSWPHYLKQRWSNEQRERLGRRVGGRASAKRSAAPPRQFPADGYKQPLENF
jgi:hypothetical protein